LIKIFLAPKAQRHKDPPVKSPLFIWGVFVAKFCKKLNNSKEKKI